MTGDGQPAWQHWPLKEDIGNFARSQQADDEWGLGETEETPEFGK